jgi:hypothetical protein
MHCTRTSGGVTSSTRHGSEFGATKARRADADGGVESASRIAGPQRASTGSCRRRSVPSGWDPAGAQRRSSIEM